MAAASSNQVIAQDQEQNVVQELVGTYRFNKDFAVALLPVFRHPLVNYNVQYFFEKLNNNQTDILSLIWQVPQQLLVDAQRAYHEYTVLHGSGAQARPSRFQHYQKVLMITAIPPRIYEHQHDAIVAIIARFLEQKQAGLPQFGVIVLPPGTGKSGIVALLPYRMGVKRVLIVAPRCTVQGQLTKDIVGATNNRLEFDPSGRAIPIRSFLEKRKLVPPRLDPAEMAPITLAPSNFQELSGQQRASATVTQCEALVITAFLANSRRKKYKEVDGEIVRQQRWKDVLKPSEFDLVIIDEAHHYPSKHWNSIRKFFYGKSPLLFLTATPYRSDDKPVVNHQDDIVYRQPRDYFVQRRIIRRVVPDVVQFDAADENLINSKIEVEQGKERQRLAYIRTMQRLEQLLNSKDVNMPLPGDYRHKAIAIVPYRPDAEQLKQEADRYAPNLKAQIYNLDLNVKERQDTLRRHEENRTEYRLIIVCGMLLEGWDHPATSVAVILYKMGNRGPRFVQFLGRAVRVFHHPQTSERENENVVAHVLWHQHYDQSKNFDLFENDKFGQPRKRRANRKAKEETESSSSSSDSEDDTKIKVEGGNNDMDVEGGAEAKGDNEKDEILSDSEDDSDADGNSSSGSSSSSSSSSSITAMRVASIKFDQLLQQNGNDWRKALNLFFRTESASGPKDDLSAVLSLYGRTYKENAGGGRCFYLALADQINYRRLLLPGVTNLQQPYKDVDANFIKNAILTYMKQLPYEEATRMLEIIMNQQVVERMRRPDLANEMTWRNEWAAFVNEVYGAYNAYADLPIMLAATRCFQLEIDVFSSNANTVHTINNPNAPAGRCVEIGYFPYVQHFVSVVPIVSSSMQN